VAEERLLRCARGELNVLWLKYLIIVGWMREFGSDLGGRRGFCDLGGGFAQLVFMVTLAGAAMQLCDQQKPQDNVNRLAETAGVR
jgi:hypothetical protein